MAPRWIGFVGALALAAFGPAGMGDAQAAALPASVTPTAAPAEWPMLPAVPPLRTQTLVHLDWHGSLRTRAESLGGVRINADNALLPVHLDVRHGAADKASEVPGGRMSSADVRLRLEPLIQLGDSAKVGMQLDAMGLLGDNAAVMTAETRFGTGEFGNNPLKGGLMVRRAWASLRVLGLANVAIGRMADHFGLGMVRNQGGEFDQDYQSDVDRVLVTGELMGFRLALGRANLASLPLASEGGALANYNAAVAAQQGTSNGVPDTLGAGNSGMPLQDSADVIRWDVAVGGGKLVADRGLLWDAALLWQSQDFGLRGESTQTPGGPSPRAQLSDPSCGVDCAMLTQRGLRLYTFQAALDWHTVWGGFPLRLQAESALEYGTIARSDITIAADAKTILAGGAALRAKWQRPATDWLLDVGVATGEADGGFGVNDTTNFKMGGVSDGAARAFLTGFRFHRSYRVDGLLFRDLIGAVANTLYVRPAWRWPMWQAKGQVCTLELGLLGAVAASADATPGLGRWIGVEPDATLRLQRGQAHAFARATVVLPGAALANPGGAAADPAWRVDAGWKVAF